MSGRIRDCVMCDGTGIDEDALDERCTSCGGSGRVADEWDDYDPYLDEPNYHDVPEDEES